MIRVVNKSIKKYEVDAWGTEEILGNSCAPTLDINYGNEILESTLFKYRPTKENLDTNISGIAELVSVKGNTIAWNRYGFTNVVRQIDNTDGTGYKYEHISYGGEIQGGHKIFEKLIFSKCNITQTGSQNVWLYQNVKPLGIGGSTGSNMSTTYLINGTKSVASIGTSLLKTSDCQLMFRIPKGTAIDIKIAEDLCIDLTLIYGEGNEPSTAEEFEADYQRWFGKPLTYEPYDSGSLRPVFTNGIKTVGFNQYNPSNGLVKAIVGSQYQITGTYNSIWESDEEEVSFVSYTYGEATEIGLRYSNGNGRYMCNSDVAAYSNTSTYGVGKFVTYDGSIHKCSTAITEAEEWDASKWTLVADISAMVTEGIFSAMNITPDSNGIFTPTKFYVHVEGGNNTDTCVHLTWSGTRNGEYEPYKEHVVPFDVTQLSGKLNGEGDSVVVFPDGMKRVNDVYDEIVIRDGKTWAIKRVDSRAYTEGDNDDTTVVTDGHSITYVVATPQEYLLDGYDPKIKKIFLNNNEIIKAYKGDNKVYGADWYGIKWCEETNTIKRIGNTDLHRTLPILSLMRRCTLNDDGTVYKYISDSNPLEYEDGTIVNYDGTDGQIMVEIPEYYHLSGHTIIDGKQWNYIKLYPNTNTGVYSKKYYLSAFELTLDSSTNSTAKGCSVSALDLNAMLINSSTTVINASDVLYLSSASIYRNYNYNNVDTTSVKCSYGRPRTGISRATFRTICKNRGTNWSQLSWDTYNSLLRLYFVEYANFNSLATFNPDLTSEGYKQGGLGNGVTNVIDSDWSSWNSYNPFIPCGVTIGLGNITGIIGYHFADGEWKTGSELTTYVPSYRGIENPFGHIWKFIDGFNRKGVTGSIEQIYICDDVNKFAESAADGYELISETKGRATGNIGGIVLDSSGTFWPKPGGHAIYSDYFYNAYSNNTWYSLSAGGGANGGARAGLLYLNATRATSSSNAGVGGRLQYTNQ